jgi:hypothetical protein
LEFSEFQCLLSVADGLIIINRAVTTVYTGPVTLHFLRTEPVIALLLAALPLLLDTGPASLRFLGAEPARLNVLLAS